MLLSKMSGINLYIYYSFKISYTKKVTDTVFSQEKRIKSHKMASVVSQFPSYFISKVILLFSEGLVKGRGREGVEE